MSRGHLSTTQGATDQNADDMAGRLPGRDRVISREAAGCWRRGSARASLYSCPAVGVIPVRLGRPRTGVSTPAQGPTPRAQGPSPVSRSPAAETSPRMPSHLAPTRDRLKKSALQAQAWPTGSVPRSPRFKAGGSLFPPVSDPSVLGWARSSLAGRVPSRSSLARTLLCWPPSLAFSTRWRSCSASQPQP